MIYCTRVVIFHFLPKSENNKHLLPMKLHSNTTSGNKIYFKLTRISTSLNTGSKKPFDFAQGNKKCFAQGSKTQAPNLHWGL